MTGKTRYKVGLLDVEISFIFLLLYWIIGREVITCVMFKSVGYDTHIHMTIVYYIPFKNFTATSASNHSLIEW